MPRINYEIDEDLHRQAKAIAALEGMTLREFVEWALELAVAEQGRLREGRNPKKGSSRA